MEQARDSGISYVVRNLGRELEDADIELWDSLTAHGKRHAQSMSRRNQRAARATMVDSSLETDFSPTGLDCPVPTGTFFWRSSLVPSPSLSFSLNFFFQPVGFEIHFPPFKIDKEEEVPVPPVDGEYPHTGSMKQLKTSHNFL